MWQRLWRWLQERRQRSNQQCGWRTPPLEYRQTMLDRYYSHSYIRTSCKRYRPFSFEVSPGVCPHRERVPWSRSNLYHPAPDAGPSADPELPAACQRQAARLAGIHPGTRSGIAAVLIVNTQRSHP